MRLNELRDEAHGAAVAKGWWESGDRDRAEILQLMVTEVAEASEEVRNRKPEIYWNTPTGMVSHRDTGFGMGLSVGSTLQKPEGEAIELADTIIRIADHYGRQGWDWWQDMRQLMNREPVAEEESINSLVRYFTEKHACLCQTRLGDHLEIVRCIANAGIDKERENLCRATIKIMVIFGYGGWNLEQAIAMKLEYNATRSYRHGNKSA